MKTRFLFLTLAVWLVATVTGRAAVGTQPPGSGGSGGSLNVTSTVSGTFPIVIVNNTNITLPVPPTNRPMVMSSVDKQMTNAFKRFYYDTNVAPSLSNLVAAASRGDVIELGAGDWYIGTQSIRPPFGVTLKGQGRGATVIRGNVGGTPATNVIVQLQSDCVYEDMTIVANKKGSYYQWPMGNGSVWGNTPVTNVVIRNVELDGDTDCISVIQAAWTSGTVYNCYFHSGGDVFNLTSDQTPIGLPGQTTPGNLWKFYETVFYSDASAIQLASWASNPTANAFQLNNGSVEFYNCSLIATNHKASAFRFQGLDTNRVVFLNTVLSASGTNGWGYEVLDDTGVLLADGQLIRAEFYNTPLKPADLSTDKVMTFKEFTANTLYSTDDAIIKDGTFTRTLTVTNELLAQTVNTTDLNATGASVLDDVAIGGTFIFTDGNEGLGKVLGDTDGSGTIGWVTGGSGSSNMVAVAGGQFTLTNAPINVTTNLTTNSVQVADLGTRGTFYPRASGPTTIVCTNVPAVTNIGTDVIATWVFEIEQLTANSTVTFAHRDTIMWNGGAGFKLSTPPATNVVTLKYRNGAWTGFTDAVDTSGSGAYALTNAPTISSPTITGTATVSVNSNLQASLFQICQPSITQSNLLINPSLTNLIECVGLTNVVLTNLVELTTGVNGKARITIRNTLGSSVAVALPAFGAQHGYYFHTNGYNDVLSATVAPPGSNTVFSLEFDGTNIYPTVTYWRHP